MLKEVLESSRAVLKTRYSLLPYLYTQFFLVTMLASVCKRFECFAWQAHRFGGVVFHPLFYDFPADARAYSIDEQFLCKRALTITA